MFSRNTHVPAPGTRRTFASTLGVSALGALVAAGLTAPAMAAEISSGGDDVSLTLSGQVNRGVLFVDDGTDTEVLHVDNDNSSTRFRMIGKGTVNEDVTVGTQVEVQFESQSTANVKIDDAGFGDANTFTERKLEFFFDSKRYGRLWLGQGDTASNGTSEVDLSGTTVIAYSGIADMSGGIEFRDGGALPNRADLNGGDVTASEIQRINKVFSNFDGLSRTDRIRYDTPNFGGIKLSVSNTDGDTNDVAARFSGDIGAGLKLVAAVAWAQTSSLDSQINGSASVLHDSGLSLTAAAGTQERANPNPALQVDDGTAVLVPVSQTEDPTFFYVKLGYQFGGDGGLGKTALAVDYTQVNDLAVDDDEFTAFGAFVVQNIDSAGTELYLGVRQHQLDRTGADFDDISSVLAGARVKF